MNKKKDTSSPDATTIKVLIFCPSGLILSGILKALETDPQIEVVTIEKNTIESLMDSIRKLQPHVILFASTETLPNMREICKV